ncbi:MAG: hypothetical protein ACPGGB_06965, partial [Flavobacteriales bacterium]
RSFVPPCVVTSASNAVVARGFARRWSGTRVNEPRWLIGTAMRHAASRGAKAFDFGGSQDQGVDRFYAEFGAERIPKVRLVRIRGWWTPILRWRRPDLFPR